MSERSIFLAALEIEDPSERSAYLNRTCAGDAALRAQVEQLLKAHRQPGRFMERPASALVATVDAPAAEKPGAVIGPYKLLEQIGEGGFGTVFLAEQTEPVRRRVALKVLKPGMESRQVVARFEAERQALALMDHPNIARVLDGGQTTSGRPYFVMDLVKGLPITEYCDQAQLTPRARLELFVHLCQAVQHAHQKGIIHRDLKPSNVLVTVHDTTPVVKVIDFGVAKALGQELTDKTVFTGFAQMIGTPLYMSPEQAGQSGLDVDTRSDIYSLGVLLYELLTGTTPFDRERFKQAGYDEIRRIIREEEPARPSARLSELGGQVGRFSKPSHKVEPTSSLASVAAQRQTEPAKLTKLLRGELDWIVMKALDKDRNRRYETASAFAADVQHYLNDEPVLACPPSVSYRLRKFARRNRGRLVAAGVLGLALLIAVGGIGRVAVDRAARQAKAANDLELALDRAELFQGQGKRAEALAAFERAELLAGQARRDTARDERLAALKERLAAEARDQEFSARLEEIRLRVRSQVNVAQNRFTSEAAFPEIRDALRRYGIAIGDMAPAQAAVRIQGRPESIRPDLIAALDECLALEPQGDAPTRQWLLAALEAADNDPWRVRVRKARVDGAWQALEQQARAADVGKQPPSFLLLVAHSLPAEGRATRLGLLRRIQRAYPADLWANHDLADELMRLGQPAEAIRYFMVALALRPKNPGISFNLGNALLGAGEVDAAIAHYLQSLALAPQYAAAHRGLGDALSAKGRLDEAIAEYQEAIRIKKDAVEAHNGLGTALYHKGRLDEAIAEYQEAIRIKKDLIAEWDPVQLEKNYAMAHNGLGTAFYAKGRLDEAIAAFREAIRLQKDYAQAHCNLGNALHDKGQLDDAIAEYREAIRLNKNDAPAHYNLGNALRAKGQLDAAVTEYRAAIRIKPGFAEAHCNLGLALRNKGQLDDAIAEFREAIRVKKDLPEAHCGLGLGLRAKGCLDEAIAEYRAAIRLKKDYPDAHVSLGNALYDKGQLDAAIAAFRAAIHLNKDYALAHYNLGNALHGKGQLDDAIAEYRAAIRLDKDYAPAHYSLGNALRAKGQLDAAVTEYCAAIRIKPDFAEAHCNLGLALQGQGEFRKALEELRRGHELGSKDRRWPYPSARWVRQCEREVELDARLPDFLEGKATPASAAERVELAELCCLKHLNRAAARSYGEAFAAEPKLADNPGAGHRYNAACAAALAGCGQGKDADKLDGQERARLRRQALDWLRADLAAWDRLLGKAPDKGRSAARVTVTLQHWLVDSDFAGVRGPEALAQLPEAERQPWQKLWGRVADTLAQAQGMMPKTKGDAK